MRKVCNQRFLGTDKVEHRCVFTSFTSEFVISHVHISNGGVKGELRQAHIIDYKEYKEVIKDNAQELRT